MTPTVPTIDPTDENQLTFNITNTGRIDTTARLELMLKDPEGIIAWSDVKEFSILRGATESIQFPLTLINLKFGIYKLIYRVTTQTGVSQ